ncbi:MAG TPA: response regulator transcription factor [Acidimicrobiales bacterium]|nr:response regulator transcription factor [Acidimicrobiales bacterium]
MKVLLADDSDSLRAVVRLALATEGPQAEVRESANGDDALAAARSWRPDAVIVDLTMPGLSGPELVADLRRELPDSLIVVFSCGAYATEAPPSRAAGADAYLEKVDGPLPVVRALRDGLPVHAA